jgi:hypothetical protein
MLTCKSAKRHWSRSESARLLLVASLRGIGQAHAASIEVKDASGNELEVSSDSAVEHITLARHDRFQCSTNHHRRGWLCQVWLVFPSRLPWSSATRFAAPREICHTPTDFILGSLAHLQLHNDVESLKDTPAGITRIEQ